MKEQVKDMFTQIVMPEETEQKIRQAIAREWKPRKRNSGILRAAAAAAAMLALILAISPTARAAVGEFVRRVIIYEDTGLTLYEETDAEGVVSRVIEVNTESPAFAIIKEGRLYFVADGQNEDITEQIREDKPFYYTYVDEQGYTHYLVVGYSGSLENYGIYEFIREIKEGQKEWEGWVGGTGRNFIDPETEARYPWVDLVWEELDVPWPMPDK